MSTVRERLQAGWATVVETAGELRAGYQRANAFARMRIWILGALVADLLIVLLVVFAVSRPEAWVEVALQTGFPADMLILRNLDDDPMTGVRVVLDGEFEAFVERIEGERTVGLELIREFRNADGAFPPSAFRPSRARIEWHGRSEVHDVPIF